MKGGERSRMGGGEDIGKCMGRNTVGSGGGGGVRRRKGEENIYEGMLDGRGEEVGCGGKGIKKKYRTGRGE